jgi:hypothetical protein
LELRSAAIVEDVGLRVAAVVVIVFFKRLADCGKIGFALRIMPFVYLRLEIYKEESEDERYN